MHNEQALLSTKSLTIYVTQHLFKYPLLINHPGFNHNNHMHSVLQSQLEHTTEFVFCRDAVL